MFNRYFKHKSKQEEMVDFAKSVFYDFRLSEFSIFNIIDGSSDTNKVTGLKMLLPGLSQENKKKLIGKIEEQLFRGKKRPRNYSKQIDENGAITFLVFSILMPQAHMELEKEYKNIPEMLHVLYKAFCQAYQNFVIEKHAKMVEILTENIAVKDLVKLILFYHDVNIKTDLRIQPESRVESYGYDKESDIDYSKKGLRSGC